MIKTICLILAVAAVGLLIFAATKPDTFEIRRTILVEAPPEKVYAVLEDFDRAKEWSPYEQKDPNLKRERSGPAKGKGAIYRFQGNKDAGTGTIEVIDAVPPNRVTLRLDMTEPMAVSNRVDYIVAPAAGASQSRVTWAMSGAMPYIAKVFSIFLDMDKIVGKDFEQGLANLKAVVEKS